MVVRLSCWSNKPMLVLRLTYSPRGPAVTPNGSGAVGHRELGHCPVVADRRCRMSRWSGRHSGRNGERDEHRDEDRTSSDLDHVTNLLQPERGTDPAPAGGVLAARGRRGSSVSPDTDDAASKQRRRIHEAARQGSYRAGRNGPRSDAASVSPHRVARGRTESSARVELPHDRPSELARSSRIRLFRCRDVGFAASRNRRSPRSTTIGPDRGSIRAGRAIDTRFVLLGRTIGGPAGWRPLNAHPCRFKPRSARASSEAVGFRGRHRSTAGHPSGVSGDGQPGARGSARRRYRSGARSRGTRCRRRAWRAPRASGSPARAAHGRS